MALELVRLEGTFGPIIKLQDNQSVLCTVDTIRETEMPNGKATLVDCITSEGVAFSLSGHTMLVNALKNDIMPLPQIYLLKRTGTGENKRGNAPVLYEVSRIDMTLEQIYNDAEGAAHLNDTAVLVNTYIAA